MKFFFFSDIHGSLPCCEAALAAFAREEADQILLLGDALYHGARNPLPEGYNPKETALLLNRYADRITAVRGNCDSEVDEMVLDFPVLATYSLLLHEGRRFFLTHGHVFGPDKLPKLRPGDALVSGHTHVPTANVRDGIILLNPGSVTMPKEGAPRTYAVLDGGRFRVRTMDGGEYAGIDLA